MSTDQDSSNSEGAPGNGSLATSTEGAVDGQQQAQGEGRPAQQQRSGWDMLRTILFQVMIFYFISSFFRGRQTPPTNPDGSTPLAGTNLFSPGLHLVSVCVFN